MKYGFGIDLGGTTVKIAYFDETGNLLQKWEIPTVTEGGGLGSLRRKAESIGAAMQVLSEPEFALIITGRKGC